MPFPPARFSAKLRGHARWKKLVFAQLTDLIHPEQFRRCVRRYDGDYKGQNVLLLESIPVAWLFGQLTFRRESARCRNFCLGSRPDQLYHLGIRGQKFSPQHFSRDANRQRVTGASTMQILAQQLIRRARALYQNEPTGLELKRNRFIALDSTTIDLCFELVSLGAFSAAPKGAIKVHTLLDLRGSIPAFISVSHGKMADVRILDELVLEPGSFYVMDRGYLDFRRLYCFVLAAAFFVTRAKVGPRTPAPGVAASPARQRRAQRSDCLVGQPFEHPALPG